MPPPSIVVGPEAGRRMRDPDLTAALRRLRAQVRAAEDLARSWELAVGRGRAPEGFVRPEDVAVAADRLRRALVTDAVATVRGTTKRTCTEVQIRWSDVRRQGLERRTR
jgi:hypothetical protein